MSWREEAQRLFPTVSLENTPRASVPTAPAFRQVVEADTVGTLAHLTGAEPDQHVADWFDREERAAVFEFEGHFERQEAERRADTRR